MGKKYLYQELTGISFRNWWKIPLHRFKKACGPPSRSFQRTSQLNASQQDRHATEPKAIGGRRQHIIQTVAATLALTSEGISKPAESQQPWPKWFGQGGRCRKSRSQRRGYGENTGRREGTFSQGRKTTWVLTWEAEQWMVSYGRNGYRLKMQDKEARAQAGSSEAPR